MGKVILVGAGPGAADLVTVRGLAAIREADAIVYDRLVSRELLAEAKAGCELHYAGKASGAHSMEQDEINSLLFSLAQRFAKVVRLKGGDPFVFGCGGAEVRYLRERGIAVGVVPGVTSALAAPAAAGIPVTAHGVADSFSVANGHSPVRTGHTRIYLMGLSRIAAIVQELAGEGLAPDTPVAVIADATLPTQRCVAGTLAGIADKVAAAALRPPAVIVVGEVCRSATIAPVYG